MSGVKPSGLGNSEISASLPPENITLGVAHPEGSIRLNEELLQLPMTENRVDGMGTKRSFRKRRMPPLAESRTSVDGSS